MIFLAILSDVLPILRHSWPFGPLSLMSLLQSWPFRRLFLSRLPLLAPLAVSSLLGPLHTAGRAQHISRFRTADNFCRNPTLSQVLFFGPRQHHTTKHRSPMIRYCQCSFLLYRVPATPLWPLLLHSMSMAYILSRLPSKITTASSIRSGPVFGLLWTGFRRYVANSCLFAQDLNPSRRASIWPFMSSVN
jgi:hypothetical protein